MHGLVGAAEMNGRTGVVVGVMDSESRRYDVHVDLLKGEYQERVLKVKAANLKLPTPVSSNGQETWRPTALTARPGKFRASYDWREVSHGQSLPRGMEVGATLDSLTPRTLHESTIALRSATSARQIGHAANAGAQTAHSAA